MREDNDEETKWSGSDRKRLGLGKAKALHDDLVWGAVACPSLRRTSENIPMLQQLRRLFLLSSESTPNDTYHGDWRISFRRARAPKVWVWVPKHRQQRSRHSSYLAFHQTNGSASFIVRLLHLASVEGRNLIPSLWISLASQLLHSSTSLRGQLGIATTGYSLSVLRYKM